MSTLYKRIWQLGIALFLLIYCYQSVNAQGGFKCDGRLYFFRDATGAHASGSAKLAYIDNYWDKSEIVDVCKMPFGKYLNALGANPVDGYLYFSRFLGFGGDLTPYDTGIVYRLDDKCNVDSVGRILYTIWGTFDHVGRYWVIHKNTNPATLVAYDIQTMDTLKGPYPINVNVGEDIVYSFRDCNFYWGNHDSILSMDTNGNRLPTIIPGFYNTFTPEAYGGFAIGVDQKIYTLRGSYDESYLVYYDPFSNTSAIIDTITPGQRSGSRGFDMTSFVCTENIADFSLEIDTSITEQCFAPVSVQFSDSSSGLINNWYWDFGDGSFDTIRNPIHQYSSMGRYTITLIVKNDLETCIPLNSDTLQYELIIGDSIIEVSFQYDPIVCNDDKIEVVTLIDTNVIKTKYWTIGDTTIETSNLNFNPSSINDDTVISLSFFVEDTNGCEQQHSIAIRDITLTTKISTGDTTICSGGGLWLTGDINVKTANLIWNGEVAGDSFLVTEEGIITLTASYLTCNVYDTVLVDYTNCDIFIPNVFSPNGDGINDRFYIYNQEKYAHVDMTIFDRLGNVIFNTNERSEFFWDGSYKGKVSEQGVYTYRAHLMYDNGYTEQVFGNVLLEMD